MKPTLSLVTGTVNRKAAFLRLVNSVRRHTDVSWELIVSDGSDDPTYTQNLGDGVIVIPERPRLGYVRGYNEAFRHCTGKWVIWLNDDAEVMHTYASRAVRFMETHPKIGLGCLAFRDKLWPDEFRVSRFWGIPYANFGIISREFGNEIGWFWDDLTMYGSDNAITFDVLLAGRGVAAIRGQFIHHYRPEDMERRKNQVRRAEDKERLYARYYPQIEVLREAYVRYSI